MRLFELTILVVLLSGCASPTTSPPIISAPVQHGAAIPASCAATACSYEWWNATIEGASPFVVTLPVPIVWSDPAPRRADATSLWLGAPTVTNGSARVQAGVEAIDITITGAGHARAAWSMVRAPEGSRTPDEFLRARWGPSSSDVRPLSIRADASGAPTISLTYEARSDLCTRTAWFEGQGEGSIHLDGNDTARCG